MLVLLYRSGEILDNVMQCLFTEKTRQEEKPSGRKKNICRNMKQEKECICMEVERKTIENCQKQGLAQEGNIRQVV